jgi:hypothetical protein
MFLYYNPMKVQVNLYDSERIYKENSPIGESLGEDRGVVALILNS